MKYLVFVIKNGYVIYFTILMLCIYMFYGVYTNYQNFTVVKLIKIAKKINMMLQPRL